MLSPSIQLQHRWDPVKQTIEQEVYVETERPPFDEFDEPALSRIIISKVKLAEHTKNKGPSCTP